MHRTPEPEHDALLSCLDDQRTHLLLALDGLSEADLRRSVLPSGWTPLGLVNHLTIDVERFWFRVVVAGERLALPTDDAVWRVPQDRTAEDVVQCYRAEARRSDEVIRTRLLDAPSARWPLTAFPGTPDRDLRATVLHVIAETAAHAGHLDVVRELLDGHQHLVMTDFSDTDLGGRSPQEEPS
ncbi:DinB family protein [Kineococcus esterisolvens]|uniref:DinB family protein n=1 Tax=unclassified Kineococcus TaxID=2621656 RepID=UPI003D7D21D7